MSAERRAELCAVFLATSYGTTEERFGLSRTAKGAAPPSWAAGGETWAIVTAWNPEAVQRERATNEADQRLLEARITREVHTFLRGVNGEGEWAERSLIIPGASWEQARDWAADFGQAAALWGEGARAALVWPGTEGLAPEDRCWTVPLRPERGRPDRV